MVPVLPNSYLTDNVTVNEQISNSSSMIIRTHKQIPKPMMTFDFGMTPSLVSNENVKLNLKMYKTGFGFHCFAE